jgi:hypothetical protein
LSDPCNYYSVQHQVYARHNLGNHYHCDPKNGDSIKIKLGLQKNLLKEPETTQNGKTNNPVNPAEPSSPLMLQNIERPSKQEINEHIKDQ